MASDPITILHLSDIQFGRHHRFAADEGFDTLYQRLEDDLRGLAEDHELHPNLVVVTGDLAEWGLAKEFDEARRFLERLESYLELPRRQIIVIPGNHDVNRKICEGYFAMCAGEEQKPQPPFWPKWKHYAGFFNRYYVDVAGIEFTEDEPWTIFPIDGLRVVVAGLNSTMAESHLDEDHYGQLGEKQLRWFAEKLQPYQHEGWLRIGAVHHNPFRGAKKDDANLRDIKDFDRYLGSMLNLVLHGHTHEAKLQWLRNDVPVLTMGSAGVNAEDRPPEVPNQYQIVQVRGDGFRRFARCYSGDQKRWIGDTRITGNDWKDNHSFLFRGIVGTFEDAPVANKTDDKVAPFRMPKDDFPQDDFLARVERICALREKDGTKIRRVCDEIDYLSVTVAEGGGIVKDHLVAALEDVTAERFDAFLHIHRRYRRADPGSTSTLVHADEILPDTRKQAMRERVRLQSFVEYQGLIDFSSYVEQQTRRLETDPIYHPALYVPQQIDYRFGDEDRDGQAIETVTTWLEDTMGRFVLVLGDFGTGKTFLLHEIARRLGEAGGPLVPVLIEMRELEKGRSLNELVAQHFVRAGMEELALNAFRYMLKERRIALLFDGFDELALRVTYDRATDHLETLLEAAEGHAKVVVTSRTQHFESDRQIGERLRPLPGHRIVHLRKFDNKQIFSYLKNRLGSEEDAQKRIDLLAQVKDLMGLSDNPRMLGFIADLEEEKILEARDQRGEITAAELYRMILEQWLEYEVDRLQPHGAAPGLSLEERMNALVQVALSLWGTSERSVGASGLTEEVSRALEGLGEGQIPKFIATHQVGSGTLLVRNAEGAFSFIHQSVLEWLVARQAAEELKKKGTSEILKVAEMSPLMVDFFCDLAGRDLAMEWGNIVSADTDETVRKNAFLVGRRLGDILVKLRDLRGRDFSHQVLLEADFSFADMTTASFVGSTLTSAQFQGASLVQVDFSSAVLRDANLNGANLSEARVLGADLTGAKLDGTIFHRTKLVGATLDVGLAENRLRSSAPPQPSGATPWTWTPGSSCTTVAWSPDGSLVATGHQDSIVRIWDATSGQEIRRFLGHRSGVWCVSFSPVGGLLASGSSDGTVRLWNIETGDEGGIFRGHQDPVRSVCFSPRGNLIASGSYDNTVRLWNLQSKSEFKTLEGHQSTVFSVSFSPKGDRLASGSYDKTVRLWNVQTGDGLEVLRGHSDPVLSVAFSPKGDRLASGSYDKTVRLWSVEAAAKTMFVLQGHKDQVLSVCFSPHGDRLASGSFDSTVRLWDIQTGRENRVLKGYQYKFLSVCFSPKGDRLAAGSYDKTVRLWDVQTGAETTFFRGHYNTILSVSPSPKGHQLAIGSYDKTVRIWNVKTGAETKVLRGHQEQVTSVCFSAQGSRLASGSNDSTVRLWNAKSGTEVRTLQGHQGQITSVCFSPQGTRLASGSNDNTVRLWNVKTGAEVNVLRGHQEQVTSVCFSPQEDRLASGSYDNTVRLWNGITGTVVRTLRGHQSSVLSICFSPDGNRLASGSYDYTVRLWDVKTGTETRIMQGHRNPVLSVCFSPRGQLLASGSVDKTVRLWNVKADQLRVEVDTKVLKGHQDPVSSVCFSPKGDRLFSGSEDNTIRIWDVESGQCLAILVPLPEGWVAYTPDGRYKVGGETSGGFWHSIGLCRFEVGELDPYMDLRVPPGEPLVPGLAGGGR